MTDEQILHDYQERMGICIEDGYMPPSIAHKTAFKQCVDDLTAGNHSDRAGHVIRVRKIIKDNVK